MSFVGRSLLGAAAITAMGVGLLGCRKEDSATLNAPASASPTAVLTAGPTVGAAVTPPHETLGLFVGDASNGSVRQIWFGEAAFPRWSSDGRSIAIWGVKGDQCCGYIVDAATGESRYVGEISGANTLVAGR